MTTEAKQKAIRETAKEIDGKVYNSYSGRGMFGRTCMGIVCDDATDCIEFAAQKGLRGAVQDSMGLSVIVYWPSIPSVDSADESDED